MTKVCSAPGFVPICGVFLSGCCAVTLPPAAPGWLQGTAEVPQARSCSIYTPEISRQFLTLKGSLERQHSCCAANQTCLGALNTAGLLAWNSSLLTFSAV